MGGVHILHSFAIHVVFNKHINQSETDELRKGISWDYLFGYVIPEIQNFLTMDFGNPSIHLIPPIRTHETDINTKTVDFPALGVQTMFGRYEIIRIFGNRNKVRLLNVAKTLLKDAACTTTRAFGSHFYWIICCFDSQIKNINFCSSKKQRF